MSSLLLHSCISTKAFPQNYSGNQIEFGWGGGFSGVVHSYILLENSKLFKKNVYTEEKEFVGSIDSDLTEQIFANYRLLGIGEMNLDDPGNTYKYLIFVSSEKKHKLLWHKKPINDNLTIYFENLRSLTK